MSARHRVGRVVVAFGVAVLFLSAALHFFGGYRGGFPALAASNLDVQLQTAFRVVFLSVGWDWIVLGLVAVVAAFTAGARRRTLVMMCGVGILIEAVGDAFAMGLFIGNEMIGAAAILIVIGGALLDDGAQGALRGANLT